MYDGKVRLDYSDAAHAYYVTDSDNPDERFRVPSVTTICGIVDKSQALVPWAVNVTLDFLRKAILPDQTYSDIELQTIFETAKRANRIVKQEAADIGTQVHNWLEKYFKTGIPPEASDDEQVQNGIKAALGWLDEHKVEPVAIEKKIYSRKYKYSGTLDKLAVVDDKLCLIDWKTSKYIYAEHRFQTAAYVAAYEEEIGEKIDSRWLIQLGKATGEFDPHRFPRSHQKRDFKAFVGALRVYERLKDLK